MGLPVPLGTQATDGTDAGRDELLDVVERLGGRFHRVPPGTMLMSPWDEEQRLCAVERGLVKLFVLRPDGTERIVRFVQRLDILGLPRALGQLPHIHFARSVSEANVAFLPRGDALRRLQEDPRLRSATIRMLVSIISQLCNQEAVLHGLNSERNVAAALCLLVRRSGLADAAEPLELHLTRQDLADFLALHRVSVSRALTHLAARGWVQCRAGSLHILNLDALTRFGAND